MVLGILLMVHGLSKVVAYDNLTTGFLDPLGVGSQFSLMLAIFAELFCSVAFIFGLLYRLCLIPMIVMMAVAFFGVHGGSLSNGGELAFLYLLLFLLMYLPGPGRYSLDCLISRSFSISK